MKILKIKNCNKFHKTAEELREFIKENNIKLLRLLRYLRKRKVKNDLASKEKIPNNLC